MSERRRSGSLPRRIDVRLAELVEPRGEFAEKQTLAAMAQDAGCLDLALERLREDDFWHPFHRRVFALMGELRGQSKAVDAVSLLARLPNDAAALGELSAGVVAVLVFPDLLEQVARLGQLRRWQRAAAEICALTAGGAADDAEDIISHAESLVSAAQMAQGATSLRPASEVTASVIETLDGAIARRHAGVAAVELSTGLDSLDLSSGGLKGGWMVVIAARPGQGKTALGLQCARHNLAKGKRVGFFTLEMTAEELQRRNLAANTGVNLRKIIDGQVSASERDLICQHAAEQQHWPLFFEDLSLLNAAQLRSKARRMVGLHGVDLIVLDYLQLMEGSGEFNRATELAAITKTVKNTAKELKIPIVTLAQLNRKTGDGETKPAPHHLRESGSIEQDADMVLLLSRVEKTDEDEPAASVNDRAERHEHATLVDLAKNRNGPTGEEVFVFEGRFQRFVPPHNHKQHDDHDERGSFAARAFKEAS
ncbi:MAG: AAA family ATPase [Verrucomicrobiales bacterium]|jgi:replicative DNA helicase|nr:AAA family ATPase [Verrucomicrobiales bacterium]